MNLQEPVQEAVCVTSLPEGEAQDLGLPSNSALRGAGKPDFEDIVDRYYRPLYQFALSLTHCPADACDLAQQTFLTWSTKGNQLRDASKVRSWLFTTLHRAFLQTKRHQTRFPHYGLDEVDLELPELPPLTDARLDALEVLDALQQIDEVFRAPVALFYLQDCPYKEIAQILDIPLGTVKSRIARGISHLQAVLRAARPVLQCVAA
ncbi:MAG TPA: RNA polymerase sigma factor [Terriglobia bacterium]|nr:RNA polymerase sigma factor [Terriglobia bacterium]